MNNKEYLIKNATIDQLENLYILSDYLEDNGNNAQEVYDELIRRGEGLRWAFLGLSHRLADTETKNIVSLAKKINAVTSGGKGVFKDDFTEFGDPISEEGILIQNIMFFLEIELKDRGFTRSEVIHAIYPEPEDVITEEAV